MQTSPHVGCSGAIHEIEAHAWAQYAKTWQQQFPFVVGEQLGNIWLLWLYHMLIGGLAHQFVAIAVSTCCAPRLFKWKRMSMCLDWSTQMQYVVCLYGKMWAKLWLLCLHDILHGGLAQQSIAIAVSSLGFALRALGEQQISSCPSSPLLPCLA